MTGVVFESRKSSAATGAARLDPRPTTEIRGMSASANNRHRGPMPRARSADRDSTPYITPCQSHVHLCRGEMKLPARRIDECPPITNMKLVFLFYFSSLRHFVVMNNNLLSAVDSSDFFQFYLTNSSLLLSCPTNCVT